MLAVLVLAGQLHHPRQNWKGNHIGPLLDFLEHLPQVLPCLCPVGLGIDQGSLQSVLLLLPQFVYLMRRDDFEIGLEYLGLIGEGEDELSCKSGDGNDFGDIFNHNYNVSAGVAVADD